MKTAKAEVKELKNYSGRVCVIARTEYYVEFDSFVGTSPEDAGREMERMIEESEWSPFKGS
jgi:hypothetical protein